LNRKPFHLVLQGISKRISLGNTEEAILRQGKRVAGLFSSLTVAAAENSQSSKRDERSSSSAENAPGCKEEEAAGDLDEVGDINNGDLHVRLWCLSVSGNMNDHRQAKCGSQSLTRPIMGAPAADSASH
jgi:hypothetical protein